MTVPAIVQSRGMKRWLFNFAAALSLLVGLAFIAAWVASEISHPIILTRESLDRAEAVSIFTTRGGIGLQVRSNSIDSAGSTTPSHQWFRSMDNDGPRNRRELFWPKLLKDEERIRFSISQIISIQDMFLLVPFWLLIFLSGILPALWIRNFLRSRKPTAAFEVVCAQSSE